MQTEDTWETQEYEAVSLVSRPVPFLVARRMRTESNEKLGGGLGTRLG